MRLTCQVNKVHLGAEVVIAALLILPALIARARAPRQSSPLLQGDGEDGVRAG